MIDENQTLNDELSHDAPKSHAVDEKIKKETSAGTIFNLAS